MKKFKIEYTITHFCDCVVEAETEEEAEQMLIDSGMELGGEYDLQSDINQITEIKS